MIPFLRRAAFCSIALVLPQQVPAQASNGAGTGVIIGRITDTASIAAASARVEVSGTVLATHAREDGSYRLERVPAGTYYLRTRLLGFFPDSTRVTVTSGLTSEVNMQLTPVAVSLQRVLVTAPRMGETKAAALDRQREAANLVTVLSGDEIRALPNYNAAEAAGRMPDVSLERDEGEGKFVQIRGTEPRLSNVTIDGVHVPGTEGGDRIVKLDDVPSDILGAIEVSKTLTAEQDADAIGGSINLVTKIPEGRPRGYIAAQGGYITLLNHNLTQGGLTYGGRFGPDEKLGFLIGGSIDRTNRTINDVEPAWAVDNTGRSYPIEWSQRDYLYFRTRYGLGGDLDYRFNDHSSVYVKGMWSLFKNYGDTYVYDIATNGDSLGSGPTGIGTNAALTREVYIRTPNEGMWGFTAGGRQETGAWTIDYAANWAGTRQNNTDYRFNPFVYQPGATGGAEFNVRYDASDTQIPHYSYLSGADQTRAFNPANYAMQSYDASYNWVTGRSLGGQFNAQLTYALSDHPSQFKFGVRYRDERKDYLQANVFYSASPQSFFLNQVLSSNPDLTASDYYQAIASGFAMGPLPDPNSAVAFENSHPQLFTNGTNTVRNALASFNGSEKVYAAYAMNNVELGALQVYLGLRVEATRSDYTGNVAATDTASGVTSVSPVSGVQNYTDVFPSIQLRYGVDANTNVRIAWTRGIARPNYSDLAPSVSGNLGAIYQHSYSNLSAGNPNLKPQFAWNYDLLVERFLPSLGGVVSGGVFYKAMSDVILTRNFIYNGPYTAFDGYYGTQPTNGGTGHLVGVEAQWVEHFTFLRGAWSGLGFDVNWMHADSKVLVDPVSGREAPLLRQAPDIGNAALLYDHGRVSGRLAWTYNGPYIASYGDGSATASGDTYFYQHSQIDASMIFTVTQAVQIQVQALNLNNAQFGFFMGDTDHRFDIQREYYGRTFYLGGKYGF